MSTLFSRRWLQFGTRSLLLLMLMSAAVMGVYRWYVGRYAEQHAAWQTVLDRERAKQPEYIRRAIGDPEWLAPLAGEDVYQDVVHLSFFNKRRLTDDDLAPLAHFRRLKRLSLHGTQVSDRGAAVLSDLNDLEALSLWRIAVSDEGLRHLRGKRKLKRLELAHTNVEGPGLKHLADLHALEYLDLRGLPIEDEHLQHLAGLENLKYLNLVGSRITERSMPVMAEFKNLEELWVSSRELKSIRLENMTKLRSVVVARSPVLDIRLAHLPALETISINSAKPGGRYELVDVPSLVELYGLGDSARHVRLEGADSLTKLNFHSQHMESFVLNDVPKLKRMNLDCNICDGMLDEIANAEALAELWMTAAYWVDESGDARPPHPRDIAPLSRMRQLRDLKLSMTQIESRALLAIRDMPELRILDLQLTNVGDSGLAALARMPRLEVVNLSHTGDNLQGEGLVHLSGLAHVKSIDLSRTAIDDDGLAHLPQLPSLELLNLGGTRISGEGLKHLRTATPNLEQLHLNSTEVGDSGMRHVAKLDKLRWVGLNNTNVTARGLHELLALEKLERLSLGNLQIQAEDVSRFVEAHEGLELRDVFH